MRISFVLLSFFSGLLTALSFDFPRLSFVVWFSLVPFFYVLSKSGIKKNIIYAFIFGFTYYGAVLFWVGNVTILGFCLLLGYLSCYPLLFVLLGRYFFNRAFRLFTVPSLWVLLEFMKEGVWCGFGWANLGYSQFINTNFIQIADLGGVKLISFIIVMTNVLIAGVLFSLTEGNFNRDRKRIAVKTGIMVLILLFCFGYSVYRLNTLEAVDYLKVSLVQPNIDEREKYNELPGQRVIEKLVNMAAKTQDNALVVFPEAAWPFIVDEKNSYINSFFQEIKRDVIIGVIKKSSEYFYNTVLVFNKETQLSGMYQKIKLVPFGEYVPLRELLSFIPVINNLGDMSRGKEYVIFPYKNKKFSVLICFEDIFPDFVSCFSKGRDFLVNITNDAWFMGEPQASQHFAIMVLRAVENRISIVRCANSGISGGVNFKGEFKKLNHAGKEVFFGEVFNFDLALNKQRSFYNKFGDIFIFSGAIVMLGYALVFHKLKQ